MFCDYVKTENIIVNLESADKDCLFAEMTEVLVRSTPGLDRDEVISSLDLKNISTVHGRAEDLARMNLYRENFDLCVSRAVANLSTLSEYCIPFVKVGGQFISYKSAECNKEVDNARHAISLLGGKVKEIQKFEIGDSGRAFVSILKEKSSPKKYPRKAGVPSKMPL